MSKNERIASLEEDVRILKILTNNLLRRVNALEPDVPNESAQPDAPEPTYKSYTFEAYVGTTNGTLEVIVESPIYGMVKALGFDGEDKVRVTIERLPNK